MDLCIFQRVVKKKSVKREHVTDSNEKQQQQQQQQCLENHLNQSGIKIAEYGETERKYL